MYQVEIGTARLPDRRIVTRAASGGDLLYVSDGAYVNVYSWPQGIEVGLLQQGGADGLCVDSAGHIFMTLYQSQQIVEYAHGGKSPIGTLDDPNPRPIGCAVDPVTSNLAVANYSGLNPSEAGSVVIYPNGQGSGTIYAAPHFFFYFSCAYDASGDLFVDGQTKTFRPAIAELANGATSFTNMKLPKRIRDIPLLGGLQWDGEYLVVGDVDDSVVYRLAISGSKAIVAGSARLIGGNGIYQFFIQGSRLVGSNSGDNEIMFWKYPSGGRATKTIDAYYGLYGAAVSTASGRPR